MRVLPLLSILVLAGLCMPAGAQTADVKTADARPRVAVVVVTLDQVRQIQTRHGQSAIALLGDARWGRFAFEESPLTPETFASCRDERADGRLDYCVRFYLTRAELPADAPPTVVVAFDDKAFGTPSNRGAGEMRVTCYGRGVVPTDPGVQDTWLWPDSARMHGVNDWTRDRQAVEACMRAAASEPWTGLRQPDID